MQSEVKKFRGKVERFFDILFQYFSYSEYTVNHWRSTCKKIRSNMIDCKFLRGIWFDTPWKSCFTKTRNQWLVPLMMSLIFWHCCWSLARDTLEPFLFIICLDYVQRMSVDLMKENGLRLKKIKQEKKLMISSRYYHRCRLHKLSSTSRKYTRTIRIFLHSLEQSTRDIGLYVNVNKTDFMCFNQHDAIFNVNYYI